MPIKNLYPNGNEDRFDLPFVPRKILASDIYVPPLRERHLDVSDLYPGGTLSPIIPDDETYVAELGDPEDNINNIIVDHPIVFLTNFVGWKIRVLRNNIPMTLNVDFSWNSVTGEFQTLVLNPIEEETFTFQAY